VKWKIAIFALALGCLAVALALWPGRPPKSVLPDGTTYFLTGVQVGLTNEFVSGTLLSKTLGRLAPKAGFSFAGLKVVRPVTSSSYSSDGLTKLAMELRLQPSTGMATSPQASSHRGVLLPAAAPKARGALLQRSALPGFIVSPMYRVLISGQDDFSFVQDFGGFYGLNDMLLGYVVTENFPRDARRWRVRLEGRTPDSTDWTELASFDIKNPKPIVVPSSIPDISPYCQLEPGVKIEFGELVVRQKADQAGWEEFTADLPMRVTTNGKLDQRWEIANGFIQDASGNRGSFPAQNSETSNDWTIYHITRPLNPACWWKFDLNFFSHASDFPASNLYSFNVEWPIMDMVRTNLGGQTVDVAEVFPQGDSGIVVILNDGPPGMRLGMVDAVDDAGNHLGKSAAWTQQYRWTELLKPIEPHRQIHVMIAIRPDDPVEFVLRPRLEKSEKSTPPNTSGL
jgi:hypothetical protein